MQLTRGRGAPLPTGQPAPSSSHFFPVVCLFLTAARRGNPFCAGLPRHSRAIRSMASGRDCSSARAQRTSCRPSGGSHARSRSSSACTAPPAPTAASSAWRGARRARPAARRAPRRSTARAARRSRRAAAAALHTRRRGPRRPRRAARRAPRAAPSVSTSSSDAQPPMRGFLSRVLTGIRELVGGGEPTVEFVSSFRR